jgi:hemerythrin-like domain-containing protein
MSGEDPFVRLERSHRRLEERLDELAAAARDLSSEGAVDAVRDVAGFFARAVRRHEDDEERSLFPRLAARADLAPVLERLAREHREHESLHRELDELVADLDEGVPVEERRDDLLALATRLATAYRTHIDDEERLLFPAARASLDAAAIDAITKEMEDRRGGGGRGGGRRR